MAARKQTHTEYDQEVGKILVLSVTFKKPHKKASMVFKSVNGPAPEYLSSKFIGRPDNIP